MQAVGVRVPLSAPQIRKLQQRGFGIVWPKPRFLSLQSNELKESNQSKTLVSFLVPTLLASHGFSPPLKFK